MTTFRVEDMTCGHCASTITKALKAVDSNARITVDVAGHLVTVEESSAEAQELRNAIAEAGYTPVPVQAAPAAATAVKAGGCCGCRG